MEFLKNILILSSWVVGTYIVWMILRRLTNLKESQGDLNGNNLNTKD